MSLDIALLRKQAHQHKYNHGHCLVMSGPRYRTGAARLAARAALRMGAGLVTVGAEGPALPEHAAQLTEIMLAEVPDGQALGQMLAEDGRINALCLGPALGTDHHAADLVRHALLARRATVLDADALTLIAGDDSLRRLVHAECVLTPHRGEFARLFPALDPTDRKAAARAATAELGATLLLKGAQTIVAEPSGRAVVLDSSSSPHAAWLATAGAGDVLAGMIAGLLARGASPAQAARMGAALHVKAAEAVGPGLVAGDLPDALKEVFKTLGL